MSQQLQKISFCVSRHAAATAFAAILVGTVLTAQPARAQTYTVLHNFTDGDDGAFPYVGLTIDHSGSLYGTTGQGGAAGGCGGYGCGTVFKLSHHGTGWIFSPLYVFTGGSDGALPLGRVALGPAGTIYGTTYGGGSAYGGSGNGVIFNLKPPAHAPPKAFSPWTETVLYQFGPPAYDGTAPQGDLTFDQMGNLYGITSQGGIECGDTVYCGIVYQLAPNGTGWKEKILYEFNDLNVALPQSGVILDQAGNLYGTASNGLGAAFQLTPNGSGWTEHTLHYFGGSEGYGTQGGLIFDPAGNLYGATSSGGANGSGAVYELTPMGGNWTVSVLFSFAGGTGSYASLVRDAAGDLYGTTCTSGVHQSGTVSKLTPSGGGWTEADLYDFTGGSDGYCPLGNVITDASGSVYGTTWAGGSQGWGVVFEITP